MHSGTAKCFPGADNWGREQGLPTQDSILGYVLGTIYTHGPQRTLVRKPKDQKPSWPQSSDLAGPQGPEYCISMEQKQNCGEELQGQYGRCYTNQ